MTPRRFSAVLAAAFVSTALLWASLGTISIASAQEDIRIDRAHEGDHPPSFEEPIWILVLGGDARSGNPSRVRTDSVQIVGLDLKNGRASVLGIPRDSYVPIPGYGSNKINAAAPLGGPELAIRTVEGVSGCRFDYYMLTSFQGFRRIVDQFGGIRFNAPYRLTDPFATGPSGPIEAGEQIFNGKQALAWARSRYQRPRGDFDRSASHGHLMLAALRHAQAKDRRDPATLLRALAVLRRHVDLNIPIDEAIKIGLGLMKLDPKDVRTNVVDGTVGTAGAASVVRITQQGRSQLLDICDDAHLSG